MNLITNRTELGVINLFNSMFTTKAIHIEPVLSLCKITAVYDYDSHAFGEIKPNVAIFVTIDKRQLRNSQMTAELTINECAFCRTYISKEERLVAISDWIGYIAYHLKTSDLERIGEAKQYVGDTFTCKLGLGKELLHLINRQIKIGPLTSDFLNVMKNRIFIIRSLYGEQLNLEEELNSTLSYTKDCEDNEYKDLVQGENPVLLKDPFGVIYSLTKNELVDITQSLPSKYYVDNDTHIILEDALQPRKNHLEDRTTLRQLCLPDELTDIQDGAFSYNEALAYVNIPLYVQYIGKNPFAGCKKLHQVLIQSPYFTKLGTLLFNKEKTRLIACLPSQFINNIGEFWPLLEFARAHGKMQVGLFTNKDTNENFHSCIFTDSYGVRTFCSFSSKLGELSPREIANRKNELYVVQLPSGHYSLYSEKQIFITPQKHITLEEGLLYIDSKAFYGDKYLQEITLPRSIIEIGSNAFYECTSLKRINIPLGERKRFEEMIPEAKDKLFEILDEHILLEDFSLPNDSSYNGEAIKHCGFIELSGQGKVKYANGDQYKGSFRNGIPKGWGIYTFRNGDTHKGFFDNLPNGIGYLNEVYSMSAGNFKDGRMNGWGIRYHSHIFKFGLWKGGRLVQDETNKTLWIRYEITSLRLDGFHASLIQIAKDRSYIRFGIPERLMNKNLGNSPNAPRWPAFGFEFYKDGSVKVGIIREHTDGNYMLFKVDGSIIFGKWLKNKIQTIKTLSDFQDHIDNYTVDGFDVF